MNDGIRRREFLQRIGGSVVGGMLAAPVRAASSNAVPPTPVGTIKDLPTRRLGRLGIQMPILSLGTAPMGHAFYRPEPFEEVVNAALDAGIRYLDVAPIYDVAEERLKPILARRRKEAFLVTKVWAKNRDDVLRSLEKSLTRLGTDHVDLCHLHNVSRQPTHEVLGKGGVLDGLREAKKRGWIKHIGCSGHQMVDRFLPVIETGEIDLLMVAMNFVDRHIYPFQAKVLPTARKHDCAIVCMKVYGGVPTVWGGYRKRENGRLAGDEYRQQAIDYALSIPGVSTLVVGLKTPGELGQAIEAVRRFRPLEGERRKKVLAEGATLARTWGARFGPATAPA